MPPMPPHVPVAATSAPESSLESSFKQATGWLPETNNTASHLTSTEAERAFVPPNFTVKELRDLIPVHCFERSNVKSFAHLAEDFALIAIIGVSMYWIDHWLVTIEAPIWAYAAAWATYSFVQGVVATGIWVIAHECGHQAFSPSTTINYTVGFVLHSALLVPFHSWRITHSMHHAHTAHLDKDQVFVPMTRTQVGLPSLGSQNENLNETVEQVKKEKEKEEEEEEDLSIIHETPIYSCLMVLLMLTVGWPLYLIVNKSGQNYPRWTSHFLPSSSMFNARHRSQVMASNLGVLTTLGALVLAGYTFGAGTVVRYYLLPYLWVNAWLVTITFLQHTDPVLPHYREPAWNFVRGALCTVDRDFGWLLNIRLHHIHDTHICHHLFSRMPFYHALEATQHLRAFLGDYYVYDRTPIWKALYRSWRRCYFVEDEGDILFFRGIKEQHHQKKA